jgi:predicted RNA-binding Zn-ribbon protein involved in translation (DUF1610 family)
VQDLHTFWCPFCGNVLEVVGHDLGEAEDTGGIGTLTEFRCPGCGAEMTNFVHDKVRRRSERWELGEGAPRLPVEPKTLDTELPVYACAKARCDGELLGAVPRGVDCEGVPPGTALTRTIAFTCTRCGTRYLRFESGTYGAPAVTGWNVLESVEQGSSVRVARYVRVAEPAVVQEKRTPE